MFRGPAKPSLFRLSIPSSINNANFSANEYLRMFCKSASIPSISHETIGANGQERMGVVRQQPVGVIYSKPLSITIIERTDFIAYNEMKEWFDRTCPDANSFLDLSHRMAYYDNYTCDIKLKKLESAIEQTITNTRDGYESPLTVIFKDAYPTEISDISFDNEAQNSLVTFDVKFNYTTYTTQRDDLDNDD